MLHRSRCWLFDCCGHVYFICARGCISLPTRPSSITPLDRLPQYCAARERTLCVHHVALPERGVKAAAVGDARTVVIDCGEGRGIYVVFLFGVLRFVVLVVWASLRL